MNEINRNYRGMAKEELAAILQPPAQQVSEKDLQLARARYVVDDLIDRMLTLSLAVRAQAGELNNYEQSLLAKHTAKGRPDVFMENALQVSKWLAARLDAPCADDEPWSPFAEHFDTHFKDGLSAMHTGDCTAVACTCLRCLVEQYYGVASSVTWDGKHEGARLLGAYQQACETNKPATHPKGYAHA